MPGRPLCLPTPAISHLPQRLIVKGVRKFHLAFPRGALQSEERIKAMMSAFVFNQMNFLIDVKTNYGIIAFFLSDRCIDYVKADTAKSTQHS